VRYQVRAKRESDETAVKILAYFLTSFLDVGRLRTFLAFDDFEFDIVSFLETLVPLGGDGAVVNKNVGAIFSTDEPVAFWVIEPLYRTFHALLASIRSPRLVLRGNPRDHSKLRCCFA
jgi:hypothetical protein